MEPRIPRCLGPLAPGLLLIMLATRPAFAQLPPKPPPPPPAIVVIPAPNLKITPAIAQGETTTTNVIVASGVQIAGVRPGAESLTLAGPVPALAPGTIIVSGYGHGLLRKVVSTRSIPAVPGGPLISQTEVTTVPAKLTDLFKKLSVSLVTPLRPSTSGGGPPRGGGPPHAAAPAATGCPTGSDTITVPLPHLQFPPDAGAIFYLDGSLAVQLGLDLGISFDWSIWPPSTHTTFHCIANAAGCANATVTFVAPGAWDPNTWLVKQIGDPVWVGDPIDIQVGPIPLVFVPQLVLDVKARGSFQTGAQFAPSVSGTMSAGLQYDSNSGFSLVNSFSQPSFNMPPPNFFASASGAVAIGPELQVLLYDVVGPYVGLDLPQAQLNAAAQTCPPQESVNLSASIDFDAGVTLDIIDLFSIGYNVLDVPLHSFPLYSQSSTPPMSWAAGPNPLSFGTQTLGQSSSPQTVSVTNTGPATVVMRSAGISAGSAFTLSNDHLSGQCLYPGSSGTVGVTFTPAGLGPQSSTLALTDATGATQNVTLSGTGKLGPTTWTASPNPLDFGDQRVGATSAVRTVTVTNTGSATLVIQSVSATPSSDFTIVKDRCTSQYIAPGASCGVDVTFTPSGAGRRTGQLAFTDANTGQSRSVTLSGNGVLPFISTVSLSPDTVTSGGSSQGAVVLNAPAPPGGALVALASTNPQVASVLPSVTIAAGSTTGPFTVRTQAGACSSASICASYGGSNLCTMLTVAAGKGSPNSLVVCPATIAGGCSTQVTVTLSRPAPAGGTVVSLGSSDPAVLPVPASIRIPAGQQSATFTVTATAIQAMRLQLIPVTITASGALLSGKVTATLTVGEWVVTNGKC